MTPDRKAILAACDALQNSRDFLKSALGKPTSYMVAVEFESAIDNLRDAAELLGFDLVPHETPRPVTVTKVATPDELPPTWGR